MGLFKHRGETKNEVEPAERQTVVASYGHPWEGDEEAYEWEMSEDAEPLGEEVLLGILRFWLER